MTFHVGQKVVFIHDYAALGARYSVDVPRNGLIYTIREFEDRGEKPALRLIEIVNAPRRHRQVPEWVEPAFAVAHFRPVVETKSEISFTEGAPKDSEKFDNRRKQRVRA